MYRTLLLRSFRRSSTTAAASQIKPPHHNHHYHPQNPNYLISLRSYAFTSAEEAANERRRRKRRLRIEPPMWALRRDPPSPQDRDPNSKPAPRLPDSTSALVGPRLNIHNRVQSLIRAGDLDSAAAIARQTVFSNIRPTVFTCNAIIAAMYRAARYHDAKILFQYFFNQSDIIPNIVSYNNLILAHCGTGDVDEALKVYRQILEEAPFSPSHFTYRNLTKGLIDAGRIDDAVDLLREMLNKGQGADSLVFNNLISGFLELGNLERAKEFFEELQERCLVYDGVVSATFMDWYFKQGREKEAMDSYKYLMDKQFRMVPATCNVLLEVLVRYGKEKEAWELFNKMLDNHTPPTFQAVNSDTFNIMVNECFRLGKVTEAMEVFKKVGKGEKSRPFAMDVAGFNNMITRLCELEMTEEAENYLAQLQSKSLSPDVTTYRTLIETYIKVEKVDEALDKYEKMVDAGLRVIPAYADKWFSFLIERGKVAECVPILMKMGEREPRPDVTTYDIVIKGLCGIGDLDTCSNVVGQMMAVGVGVTPVLKEFLLNVFEKEGRRKVIENIVNARFPFYSPPPPSAPVQRTWQPSPLRASQEASQMTGPASFSPQKPIEASSAAEQMPWRAPVSPQMPGQTSSSASQMSWQASVPYQTPGQSSAEASQRPWQASFNAQAPGHVARPSEAPGKASVSPQIHASEPQKAWQQAASSQVPGHQASGSSHMPWQGSASQMHGQASSGAPYMSWQASVPHQTEWQSSAGVSQRPWQSSFHAQVPGHVARPSEAPGQASVSPQMHALDPQRAQLGAASSQAPSHQASGSSHMPWVGSVSPQMSGQASSGAPQMSWQTSVPYETPGQSSAGVSQRLPQASFNAQDPGHVARPSEAPGQASVSSQIHASDPQREWQRAASSQVPRHQASGSSHMPWEGSVSPQGSGETVGSSNMPWS